MRGEQLEATIEAMSASERNKFVRWFDDHRHELIPGVAAAQQREVMGRAAEAESNPGLFESFEEADLDRMISDAAHARTQKAPAGRG